MLFLYGSFYGTKETVIRNVFAIGLSVQDAKDENRRLSSLRSRRRPFNFGDGISCVVARVFGFPMVERGDDLADPI